MMSPFLVELKRQIKDVRIILITGSWNDDIAQMLYQAGVCDGVCHYDAPSLNRGTANWGLRVIRFVSTFLKARSTLLREDPDIFVDLRPFSPNTLFLARICNIPFRVGFGLRGLSFTLHQEIPYSQTIALGQLFLDALPLIGLDRVRYEKPFVAVDGLQEVRAVRRRWNKPYVLFQPTSGERSKEIPDDVWSEILDVLCAHVRVVAVGSAADKARICNFGCRRVSEVFTCIAGKTTVGEAFEYARQSSGCIGVDSLFAHVALAFDLPAYVLGVTGVSQKVAYPTDNRNVHFLYIDVPGFSPRRVAHDFLDHVTSAHLVDDSGG